MVKELKPGQKLIFNDDYSFRASKGKHKNHFSQDETFFFNKGDTGQVLDYCADHKLINVWFPKQDATASLGLEFWTIFDLKAVDYNQYWAKLNEA